MSALYSCLKGKNDTIMAANQSEGMQSTETKDAPEEISGKKKSKFQAFKNLFVKKKRKESPAPSTESKLKPSQSSSDVSVSGANTTAFHSADEPVARGNMGNKAVSHDSVFISEMENSTKEDISQESTPGKVKALQLQLQQNIRIGSPPQTIVPKKQEDSGALSEDDGLPRSPPEMTSLHEILQQSTGKCPNIAQRRSSLSLGGTDSEEEPETSESSSYPISPLCYFPPLDFTSPPISVAFLDYSAAKHRIAVKPKKRRKPNMNMRQTKDVTVSEMLQEKEKEEDDRKVEPKQETPNEQVKFTEDVLIQKSEVDMTLSLSTLEMDKAKFNTENVNSPEVSETSVHEKQIHEADVTLHDSLLVIADQVKTTEMKAEREQESTSLTKSSGFQPCPEQFEIAAIAKPSEINDAERESAHLDTSQGTASNASENAITNLGDTSICGIDETRVTKITDENLIHNRTFTHLLEVQNDVPGITESTLVAIEKPHDDLKLNPDPAIMKDHKVEGRGKIAPKCVLLSESINAKHPVTMEGTLSEVIPEASDTLVSDVEVNKSIINDPPPSEKKLGTFELRMVEGSKEQTVDVNPESAPVIHKTDSIPMPLASGTHDSDADLLFNTETSMECKVSKPADSNGESKAKASNKPLRFTVAPAWQRALSVGSNAKDSSLCKSMAANKIRSESFDGAESAVDINCKKSEKPTEMDKDESCVPFGVRLRSTSSSVKCSEEYPEEFSKQASSSVDTVPLVATRIVQSPTKTVHVHSDFTKYTKPAYVSEDRNQLKPKVEELSPQEITEPAWITMAKLKQKGFKHHPLAKEQSITPESDTEVTTECFNKNNNIVTSPQKVEVKTSEVASTDHPVVSEDVQMEPGRILRSSQPQNSEEPPWFSLAKKKAKAWSEMPQSVQ